MYERCFSILKFPVLILFLFVDVIYPQINPLKPPFQIKYAKTFPEKSVNEKHGIVHWNQHRWPPYCIAERFYPQI
jgi:hypothetical protein